MFTQLSFVRTPLTLPMGSPSVFPRTTRVVTPTRKWRLLSRK